MSLIDQIRNRSSANGYDSTALSAEHIEMILEATAYSPRAANLQHFKINLVTDRVELDRLSKVVFDCNFVRTASLAMVFFINLNDTKAFFESENQPYPFDCLAGYHFGVADCLLALGAAALVAENLGYSTRVQSGGILRPKAVCSLFKCPQNNIPSLILTVGRETKHEVPKRYNLDWRTYTADGIEGKFPPWQEIYTKSGKSDADLETLRRDPAVAGHLPQAHSVPEIFAKLKYRPNEFQQFSKEMAEVLRSIFR